jgi:hypothetical protein
MRDNSLAAFGIGIAVIAIFVGGIFFMQRGDVMQLPGAILKVRTAPLDENSSVAVLDFRIGNPSDIIFEVRTVTVELEDKDGKSYLGQVSSDGDAARLFEGVPLLGQKYNKTLVTRERIFAHTNVDRMVAARFQAPVALLEGRKRFIIHIAEVDGKLVDYSER